MTTVLAKGQKADLTKSNPNLSTVVVGMGWKSPGSSIEVDFSAFLLSGVSKVTKDEDLIFYGNPSGPNNSMYVNNNLSSYAGIQDKAQLSVSLSSIPTQYERISFALTIYEGEKRRQNFSMLDDTYIRIIDSVSGHELLRFNMGKSFSVETAIVVGELYRYNGEWKFNPIGSGYSGGLEALCGSFGVDISQETQSVPKVIPEPEKDVSPVPDTPSAINLSKIELKKKGDVVNLQKSTGSMGEILVNLNWNQKKSKGFFASKGVDLDLGCLFELKDGRKGVVQALGESFGDLKRPPFVALDGDDRTGSVTTGENLRINGQHISEIKRVVIYAFIYEGVAKWSEADGIVTIKQNGEPDIEVKLDQHDNKKRMCAIAMLRNVNEQTVSIERLVEYFSGHQELDRAYNWGLRWVAGSK
ncbi:tellurite resistance protein TerA [Paenibacillus tianmuensis]|uniref:Tellurite resistance protein TerA n=1 Tax=Paenibacillus tianmuensis TaxID=624147 RepID=A0A1G4QIS2_9BACL|nr:TerD family protein [Paenibacillus tianmuensis]SCW44543.1 tellurite resistance protein TerA [Paenibacillus tianmuensis]